MSDEREELRRRLLARRARDGDVEEAGFDDSNLCQALGISSLPWQKMASGEVDEIEFVIVNDFDSIRCVGRIDRRTAKLALKACGTVVHDEAVKQESFVAEARGLVEMLKRRVEEENR